MINSFYKKRSMKLMVKNGKEHPKCALSERRTDDIIRNLEWQFLRSFLKKIFEENSEMV